MINEPRRLALRLWIRRLQRPGVNRWKKNRDVQLRKRPIARRIVDIIDGVSRNDGVRPEGVRVQLRVRKALLERWHRGTPYPGQGAGNVTRKVCREGQ